MGNTLWMFVFTFRNTPRSGLEARRAAYSLLQLTVTAAISTTTGPKGTKANRTVGNKLNANEASNTPRSAVYTR